MIDQAEAVPEQPAASLPPLLLVFHRRIPMAAAENMRRLYARAAEAKNPAILLELPDLSAYQLVDGRWTPLFGECLTARDEGEELRPGLWVAGRCMSAEGRVWELHGVFDEESKAVAACSKFTDFVAPIELNARAPEESTPFPGCYFPLIRDALGQRG